jgi:hypothetical protein
MTLAREVTGDDDPAPTTVDALADAFEEGVSATFEAECERILRAALPEPDESDLSNAEWAARDARAEG